MKDAFKVELNVGDRVIFARPNLRFLCKGSIIKITDKMITIEFDPYNTGRFQTTTMFSDTYVAKVDN